MDEGYSKAVKEVFVRLYDDGLIYRDNYIINWCPKDLTALSDIEVEHHDVEGNFWYIKYPFKEGDGYVEVATTRPETMLGDSAVAVNPTDKRFKDMIGKTVILPLLNREIPIIADDFVDPEFGTGAVKVTPAHDPNDFEIGKRHDLEQINIFTPDAKINENGGPYAGMERLAGRKKVVEDLEKQDLLIKAERHMHSVGHCYRCDEVVEPRLSLQWFVKMKPLAKIGIETVKKGNVKFTPERWLKLYYDWMENIRDWVISRQIWWGHQIPVYYCDECDETVVAIEAPKACVRCGGAMHQDEDVLDTWFSSALWPFVTLGWPEKTEDLQFFYPTSLLSTGFDILYFWVARMIVMGEYLMKDKPFDEVYIHALIRDAEGRKMSKSRGNIIDPLVMIDKYGTDALRFTMASLAVPGRDVFLSEERIEGYRNFTNKIWNMSRFVLDGLEKDSLKSSDIDYELADKWILSRLNNLILELDEQYKVYDFSKASKALYEFFWSEFADWYIELAKPRFYGDDKKGKSTVDKVLTEVLDKALRLLHPFMPFLSEEIWQQLGEKQESIMVATYPESDKEMIDAACEEKMSFVMQITSAIRGVRSELRINPGAKIKAVIKPKNKAISELLTENAGHIELLAKLDDTNIDTKAKRPAASATAITDIAVIYMPLEGLLDIDAETARLEKQIAKIEKELSSSDAKLANKSFVENAPENIVGKEKDKNKVLVDKKIKIKEQIEVLSGV